MRFDAAIARFAVTQVSKATMKHFMPWPREEEQQDATPEQVQAYLSQFVKPKKE